MQLTSIQKLQYSLDMKHKEVTELSEKKRKSAVESHNRRTNVRKINFVEGDYVLKGFYKETTEKTRHLGGLGLFEWANDYQIIFLLLKIC